MVTLDRTGTLSPGPDRGRSIEEQQKKVDEIEFYKPITVVRFIQSTSSHTKKAAIEISITAETSWIIYKQFSPYL